MQLLLRLMAVQRLTLNLLATSIALPLERVRDDAVLGMPAPGRIRRVRTAVNSVGSGFQDSSNLMVFTPPGGSNIVTFGQIMRIDCASEIRESYERVSACFARSLARSGMRKLWGGGT